ALVLCLIRFRASGLGFGEARAWKRRAQKIGFVWMMPPLLVLSLYPLLTDRPYYAHHWPLAWWLIGSIAQELLFAGFIYGLMTRIFGQPPEDNSGAYSTPVLVTAFLYSLFHWPNLQSTEHGMSTAFVQMKFAYAFLGCAWMLNIRRWTGSVW